MEIAAIASAIILAYIQNASTTHVNLNSTNSMTLNHTVRVPKCCREESVMTDYGCTKDQEHKFLPSVKVLIHNSTHVNDDPVVDVQFDSFIQNINCPMGSYPLHPEDDIFYLLENGSLVLTTQHKLLPPTQFCFESVDLGDDHEKWNTTAFICVPLLPNRQNNVVFFIIYMIGLLASCIALLTVVCVNCSNYCTATFCTFSRNKIPQRKHITLYCTSFIGSYIMVALAQIMHSTDSTCDVLGTLYYVFRIAAIGCLSLIAADTYSHVTRYGENKEIHGGNIQPTIIIICFTIMLVITVLTYLEVTSAPRMFLKPQLGQNSCWYIGKKSSALCFILPVIAQEIPNIILLLLSQMSISRFNSRYSKQMDWELLKDINLACFILFILTLVNWLWEMKPVLWEGVTKLSLPLDILECGHGVLVFLIFRRVVFQRQKYSSCDNLRGSSRNTSDTSIEPLA